MTDCRDYVKGVGIMLNRGPPLIHILEPGKTVLQKMLVGWTVPYSVHGSGGVEK